MGAVAYKNFWALAAAAPERLAVVEADGHQVSAGELFASANQVVHGLRALGLRPGDVIAAVLPNSVEAFELYLAMQQMGVRLVPINFHLVGPEIAYILQDCEARAFFAHERFGAACAAAVEEIGFPLDRAFAVGGHIDGFHEYADLKAGQSAELPGDRKLGAVMHYTSGTTGRPKGVRRALQNTAPDDADLGAALRGYGVSPDETDNVHLLACPWYHTAPLVMAAPSVHLGHPLVIMDRFDARQALEQIERYRVTITHLVPTQFVRLLGLPEDVKQQFDVSSLRHVIHGAAPCAPEVKRQMISWWGPVIEEYYASTEGVGGTIIFSDEWLTKPGSVGKARGDNEIVIMDEGGTILPPNQIGTVYSTARGGFEYYKDPEKSASARLGKYSTVGDVGYLDDDGYLYLCDRKVDMIISGGVNIYPAEVEHILITHPKVQDVAVFGIPSQEWGEEVKAIVEPAPGVHGDTALADELLGFCQGKLARYKLPKSIDFQAALPRDPSGKLYKRKLREPYWAGRASAI